MYVAMPDLHLVIAHVAFDSGYFGVRPSVMLGCEPTAVIFGVRMQAAQSNVGKVLSKSPCARRCWLASTRYTCLPELAIVRAA